MITVPARLLNEYTDGLPPGRIDLELDDATQTLSLKCARFEANIKGIEADVFPHFSSYETAKTDNPRAVLSLDPVSLRQMIEQVTFAAASDDNRPILTGVSLLLLTGQLTGAAADGFRLAVKSQNGLSETEQVEVIVPARALDELEKLLKEQEQPVNILVTAGGKQIIFHLQDTDLVSQLIEGKFPDYNQIIPKSYETRAVMDTAEFLKAVKVVNLFARDTASMVKLSVTPGSDGNTGRVTLFAVSAETGDGTTDLPAEVAGPSLEIAFNAKYLQDALGAVDTPRVALELSNATSPGTLKPVDGGDLRVVVMPMNVGEGAR